MLCEYRGEHSCYDVSEFRVSVEFNSPGAQQAVTWITVPFTDDTLCNIPQPLTVPPQSENGTPALTGS